MKSEAVDWEALYNMQRLIGQLPAAAKARATAHYALEVLPLLIRSAAAFRDEPSRADPSDRAGDRLALASTAERADGGAKEERRALPGECARDGAPSIERTSEGPREIGGAPRSSKEIELTPELTPESIRVSSRQSGARKLFDGHTSSTYWQSGGTQPHWVELSGWGEGACQLAEWCLWHAPHQSYTPKDIRLKVREEGAAEWVEIKSLKLEEPPRQGAWVVLLDREELAGASQLRLEIHSNRHSGSDSRINAFRLCAACAPPERHVATPPQLVVSGAPPPSK